MTKKTDETLLLAILDTYTSGISNSLETVAAMNGVSFRSVYSWLRDPEIILDEYMGETQISFGRAMNLARNVSKAITISRSLEDRVLNGLKVQVWHHGQPSFVDDEKAILIEDLDLRETLFGFRDGKKRDADGNRIIATRIEAPPAQLVEVYARANLPAIYGNKIEQTVRGSLSLGVTVAAPAIRRPVPPEALAFATAADLAGTVTETTLIEETYEPDLADLLGLDEVEPTTDTDPAASIATDFEPAPAPAPTPAPEPVIREQPAPAEYSPPAGWRSEFLELQRKQVLPDALNRKKG